MKSASLLLSTFVATLRSSSCPLFSRKAFLIVIIISCLHSCERKPYVEHKLQFEKVSDDCTKQSPVFNMNANFGGERYEFEKCLPADFSKDQVKVERKDSAVIVQFPKPASDNVVYHITLDIDSYPKYTSIVVDGDSFTIGVPEK